MHTMIPELSCEDRSRSLGRLACWWIETFVLIGRGDGVGMPIVHAPEYVQFIMNCYALDRHGRRRFNRCSLWRPKSCNKSGLASELCLFEALGPCRFDHWAEEGETYTFLGQTYYYAKGEPVGRPVRMPEILVLATEEGQTGNIFDSVYYNCDEGPLAQLKGLGLDVGKTRIGLPEGGEIVPSTSGAASKDGGLETFCASDETHLYTLPKLKRMYKTVQRNLAKRSAKSEPWMFEATTYFRPGEDSIAENTFKYAEDIRAGRIRHYAGLYFDYRYSSLAIEDFPDERKLEHALAESYGSAAESRDGKNHVILPDGRIEPVDDRGMTADGMSLRDPGVEPGPSVDGWVDLHGIMAQIYQPDSDVNDSIRYFLNSRASSQDSWLTESDIQSHMVYRGLIDKAIETRTLETAWQEVIGTTDEITLGFDGSVSNDSTALVGCRVRDGLLFLIHLDQCPDGPEKARWRVDRDAFDAMARRMFRDYNVVGCFADAAFFEAMIGGWESDYGKTMKVWSRGSQTMMRFYTNNWKLDMTRALQNAHTGFQYEYTDVSEGETPEPGDIGLLADPRLVAHFRNARRRERDFGYLIFKEQPKSPNKIDACMAGVLAYAARQKYLNHQNEEKPQENWAIPVRVY